MDVDVVLDFVFVLDFVLVLDQEPAGGRLVGAALVRNTHDLTKTKTNTKTKTKTKTNWNTKTRRRRRRWSPTAFGPPRRPSPAP